MLPVKFENFLEQGASTIDASVRELQRTYDEVVWGIESPPSYIEKKEQVVRNGSGTHPWIPHQHQHQHQHHQDSQGQQQQVHQGKLKTTTMQKEQHLLRSSSFGGKKHRCHNHLHRRSRNVQGTPTTDVDDSWADDSTLSDHESYVFDSSSSASESDSATMKRRTPGRSSKMFGDYATSVGCKTNNTNPQQPSVSPGSIINTSTANNKQQQQQQHQQHHHNRIHNKLEPSSSSAARSIDEIFGYNTKQTLSRSKTRLDQDVGLDFCVLDVPSSNLKNPNRHVSRTRSLLIVQSIDRGGLFANTDLGVGDAILSVNGVSFTQPQSHRRARDNSGSFVRPNLFQARALLNGRGRSVAIEYQKFGETNTSVCSSTLERTERTKNVVEHPQAQGQASSAAKVFLPRKQRPSSLAHSRRSSSSTRVDFLGMLRTTDKSTKKGRSRNAPLPAPPKTSPGGDREQPQVETPPRISRLTRLKARTQKLRTTGHKKIEASKKLLAFTSIGNNAVGSNKKDKEPSSSNNINSNITSNNTSNITSSSNVNINNSNDDGKENNLSSSNNNNNRNATKNTNHEPPKGKSGTNAKYQSDSSVLPYCSLLNHGPEEQIQLLKERVVSSINAAPETPKRDGEQAEPIDLWETTPCEADNHGFQLDNHGFQLYKAAVCSPARSTRSESYLQDLRRGLSPTANAILEDLSVGIKPCREDITRQRDNIACQPSSSTTTNHFLPDGHHRERVRINQKVFDRLQLRIDSLKRNNLLLSDELVTLKRKRDTSSQKLELAQKQLEQIEAKEQIYVTQLGLLKSRLEISNIQADKRHRELFDSKEKSIAENDRVISVLSKRIESLEAANHRLLEQLKKVDSKRQEKHNSVQAQFERLKMKFSAQSTLLDNVMTANEDLTSQNEAWESELLGVHNNNKKPPRHDGAATTGMVFAEGSEYEIEHIKRDPILLAQGKEFSSYKERNGYLEEPQQPFTTTRGTPNGLSSQCIGGESDRR
jgi:hypothetical protein